MDDIVKITQAIAYAAQALGIVVGGAWVYFKFLRGRTFAQRAEVGLEAELSVVAEKPLIAAKASVTNAGLSRLSLKENFKFIELFATTGEQSPGANVAWEKLLQIDVLVNHAWVEAQETIHDEVLLPIDSSNEHPWRGFRLQLQVWANPTLGRNQPKRWVDNAVVLANEKGGMSGNKGQVQREARQPIQRGGREGAA